MSTAFVVVVASDDNRPQSSSTKSPEIEEEALKEGTQASPNVDEKNTGNVESGSSFFLTEGGDFAPVQIAEPSPPIRTLQTKQTQLWRRDTFVHSRVESSAIVDAENKALKEDDERGKILALEEEERKLALEEEERKERLANHANFMQVLQNHGLAWFNSVPDYDILMCTQAIRLAKQAIQLRYLGWRSTLSLALPVQVTIKSIRIFDVAAMDLNGTSDPFCTVDFIGQTNTTSIIMENLSPVWENLNYEYTLYNCSSVMSITVWDWDDDDNANDLIGKCYVHVEDIMKKTDHEITRTIYNKDGKNTGKFTCHVTCESIDADENEPSRSLPSDEPDTCARQAASLTRILWTLGVPRAKASFILGVVLRGEAPLSVVQRLGDVGIIRALEICGRFWMVDVFGRWKLWTTIESGKREREAAARAPKLAGLPKDSYEDRIKALVKSKGQNLNKHISLDIVHRGNPEENFKLALSFCDRATLPVDNPEKIAKVVDDFLMLYEEVMALSPIKGSETGAHNNPALALMAEMLATLEADARMADNVEEELNRTQKAVKADQGPAGVGLFPCEDMKAGFAFKWIKHKQEQEVMKKYMPLDFYLDSFIKNTCPHISQIRQAIVDFGDFFMTHRDKDVRRNIGPVILQMAKICRDKLAEIEEQYEKKRKALGKMGAELEAKKRAHQEEDVASCRKWLMIHEDKVLPTINDDMTDLISHFKANLMWSLSAAVAIERERVVSELGKMKQSEIDRWSAEAMAEAQAKGLAEELANRPPPDTPYATVDDAVARTQSKASQKSIVPQVSSLIQETGHSDLKRGDTTSKGSTTPREINPAEKSAPASKPKNPVPVHSAQAVDPVKKSAAASNALLSLLDADQGQIMTACTSESSDDEAQKKKAAKKKKPEPSKKKMMDDKLAAPRVKVPAAVSGNLRACVSENNAELSNAVAEAFPEQIRFLQENKMPKRVPGEVGSHKRTQNQQDVAHPEATSSAVVDETSSEVFLSSLSEDDAQDLSKTVEEAFDKKIQFLEQDGKHEDEQGLVTVSALESKTLDFGIFELTGQKIMHHIKETLSPTISKTLPALPAANPEKSHEHPEPLPVQIISDLSSGRQLQKEDLPKNVYQAIMRIKTGREPMQEWRKSLMTMVTWRERVFLVWKPTEKMLARKEEEKKKLAMPRPEVLHKQKMAQMTTSVFVKYVEGILKRRPEETKQSALDKHKQRLAMSHAHLMKPSRSTLPFDFLAYCVAEDTLVFQKELNRDAKFVSSLAWKLVFTVAEIHDGQPGLRMTSDQGNLLSVCVQGSEDQVHRLFSIWADAWDLFIRARCYMKENPMQVPFNYRLGETETFEGVGVLVKSVIAAFDRKRVDDTMHIDATGVHNPAEVLDLEEDSFNVKGSNWQLSHIDIDKIVWGSQSSESTSMPQTACSHALFLQTSGFLRTAQSDRRDLVVGEVALIQACVRRLLLNRKTHLDTEIRIRRMVYNIVDAAVFAAQISKLAFESMVVKKLLDDGTLPEDSAAALLVRSQIPLHRLAPSVGIDWNTIIDSAELSQEKKVCDKVLSDETQRIKDIVSDARRQLQLKCGWAGDKKIAKGLTRDHNWAHNLLTDSHSYPDFCLTDGHQRLAGRQNLAERPDLCMFPHSPSDVREKIFSSKHLSTPGVENGVRIRNSRPTVKIKRKKAREDDPPPMPTQNQVTGDRPGTFRPWGREHPFTPRDLEYDFRHQLPVGMPRTPGRTPSASIGRQGTACSRVVYIDESDEEKDFVAEPSFLYRQKTAARQLSKITNDYDEDENPFRKALKEAARNAILQRIEG
jgi:hypothetical protein